MACEGLQERLIEEAVAPGGDPGLAAHLADCTACRAEFGLQRELQSRIAGGISAMVDGEPSAAMLARVRARIAEEPVARGFGWMWIPAGVATAALAGFAIWFGARHFLQPVGSERGAVQTVQGNSQQPTAPVKVAKAPGVESAAPSQKLHVRSAGQSVRVVITPPVIGAVSAPPNVGPHSAIVVPAGQREAVMRLVAALRAGRVDLASLSPAAPPAEITPLDIKPLKISSLTEEKAAEETGGGHK